MAQTYSFRLTAEGLNQFRADMEALARTSDLAATAWEKLRTASPQLTTALDRAQAATDRLTRSAGSAANSSYGLGRAFVSLVEQGGRLLGVLGVGGALGGVAGGAGIVGGLSMIVSRGDAATAAIGRLTASLGSLQAGREVFDQLATAAQKTGTDAQAAIGAFQRFDIAARSIGASRQETIALTTTLQKLAVVSGTSAQESASAFLQFGQALASGRLQGDELRAVLEAMPQLAELIARGMGVTIGQLRQLGSEGKLTSDAVFRAVLAGQAEVDAKFRAMPLTVDRATASMAQGFENLAVVIDRNLKISERWAQVIKFIGDTAQAAADALNTTTQDRLASRQAELYALRRQRDQLTPEQQQLLASRPDAATDPVLRQRLLLSAPAMVDPAQRVADRRRIQELEAEVSLLEELARKEALLAAQRKLAEDAARAQAAEEARIAQVKGQLQEAQEALNLINAKAAEQMQALQTVLAAGADAFRLYGMTVEQAAGMLQQLIEKTDPLSRAIADINRQIDVLRAGGADSFQGGLVRQYQQFEAAAGRPPDVREQADIAGAYSTLRELEGQRAIELAQRQLEAAQKLAAARAAGNRVAERQAQVELQVQAAMEKYGPTFDAATYRTTLLAKAAAEATESTSARQSAEKRLTDTLEGRARVAEALAAADSRGVQAAAQAARQEQARAEALKVAKEGTEAYNRVYQKTLEYLEREAAARARIDFNKYIRGREDELEILQQEQRLISATVEFRERELAALRARQELRNRADITEEDIRKAEEYARRISDIRSQNRLLENSWTELQRVGEQAFDRVGSAITDAFVKGKGQVISFGNIAKAMLSEVAQYGLRLSLLNPALNTLFGGSRPTLSSTAAVLNGAGAVPIGPGVAGTGGTGLSLVDVGGGLYRLAGSTGTTGSLMPGIITDWLNTPIYTNAWGQAATAALPSGMYGPVAAPSDLAGIGGGMTWGSALTGAASLAGGAYGLYSGIQKGGLGGGLTAAGGAAGMVAGAASLASGAGMAGALGMSAATLSAIPVYGWIAAAVLSIIGALLPGAKPSNKTGSATIGLGDGSIYVFGQEGSKFSQENRDAARSIAQSIYSISQNLEQLLGQRIYGAVTVDVGNRDGIAARFNDGPTRHYSRDQDGQRGMARDIVLDIVRSLDLPGVMRAALDRVDYSNIESTMEGLAKVAAATNGGRLSEAQIAAGSFLNWESLDTALADLTWIKDVYDTLGKVSEPVAAYTQQIEALNAQYEAAIQQAQRLHLGTDALVEAWRRAGEELAQQRQQAISIALGNLDARLARARGDGLTADLITFDLQAQQERTAWEAQLRDWALTAEDTAAQIARLEEVHAAERLAIQQRYNEQSLALEQQRTQAARSLLEQLTIGELGGLSPEARYFAAMQSLNAARRALEMGEAGALSEYVRIAQMAIPVARDFFGTSERFAAFSADVASTLTRYAPDADTANLARLIEAQARGTDALTETLLSTGGMTNELLGKVLTELKRLTAQNEAILRRAA